MGDQAGEGKEKGAGAMATSEEGDGNLCLAVWGKRTFIMRGMGKGTFIMMASRRQRASPAMKESRGLETRSGYNKMLEAVLCSGRGQWEH